MIVIKFTSGDPSIPELVGPFDNREEARLYLTKKGYCEDRNSVGLWRKLDFFLYEVLARIVQVSKPR